ncbi:glycine cleavage system protein GcvH [Microbacterium elymi]|uniref:Glycine cleavage system H protein n=1 Tax=Microbacterium elymi TaxID=2909587 RepID=A0ABY3SU34_9MICO|nr:glycine cleavage system protein GcvH [Microbacterium elymi]UJP12056.2 glycine cleavage system protein GcvH [Microbacterium elymi]
MTDLTALSYTAEHEWISFDADIATVGITDFAADKLGDVVFIELPDVGATVEGAQVCGEIESTKSVGELFAPLSGEVVETNEAVVDDPSLLNSDPFGQGWLIKLRVDAATTPDFLDRDAYVALTDGQE